MKILKRILITFSLIALMSGCKTTQEENPQDVKKYHDQVLNLNVKTYPEVLNTYAIKHNVEVQETERFKYVDLPEYPYHFDTLSSRVCRSSNKQVYIGNYESIIGNPIQVNDALYAEVLFEKNSYRGPIPPEQTLINTMFNEMGFGSGWDDYLIKRQFLEIETLIKSRIPLNEISKLGLYRIFDGTMHLEKKQRLISSYSLNNKIQTSSNRVVICDNYKKRPSFIPEKNKVNDIGNTPYFDFLKVIKIQSDGKELYRLFTFTPAGYKYFVKREVRSTNSSNNYRSYEDLFTGEKKLSYYLRNSDRYHIAKKFTNEYISEISSKISNSHDGKYFESDLTITVNNTSNEPLFIEEDNFLSTVELDGSKFSGAHKNTRSGAIHVIYKDCSRDSETKAFVVNPKGTCTFNLSKIRFYSGKVKRDEPYNLYLFGEKVLMEPIIAEELLVEIVERSKAYYNSILNTDKVESTL
ncbi:hypothetical protein [Thalassotalea sp. ND16A]|uniref:hypothetical protein n=1 Tax=Thalassotalea sp. ND16A TaxID=1535422 RepID=UPI00051A1681|nr:hypothetical protein [Thalassotalea sp. ND16A]KGJ88769.1 hypothetical protein ND16A_2471 [Thalassotalea sp. ND16A]